MLHEIREIPLRARQCHERTEGLRLPRGVPYLGMGSSHFATLALKYAGCDLSPELASEYCSYVSRKLKSGVLVSQSGRSSETLWCRKLFSSYVALVNDTASPLARGARKVVPLLAGPERYSSTKTYVNTLVALYTGFGIDCSPAIEALEARQSAYEGWGRKVARRLALEAHSFYVVGSGPNIATAQQAALILSESIKRCVAGLPLAQYDHGPKETAAGSIVIFLGAESSARRTTETAEKVSAAGAQVIGLEERDVEEQLSPLTLIVPLCFLTAYLMERLGIVEPFSVGGKVTQASRTGR